MHGNTETIEEFLTVSITDLKRLGYIKPNAYQYGVIEWKRGGKLAASAGVAVDTRGEIATVRFRYNYDGSPVDSLQPLRFAPSNLNRGGYYYFVCPVTGRSCRKLYIVAGRFVSRFAFRALYEKQTQSRGQRNGTIAFIEALTKYDEMIKAPRRKLYYRDNITPYGRKVERAGEKLRRLNTAVQNDLNKWNRKQARREGLAEPPGKIADINELLR